MKAVPWILAAVAVAFVVVQQMKISDLQSARMAAETAVEEINNATGDELAHAEMTRDEATAALSAAEAAKAGLEDQLAKAKTIVETSLQNLNGVLSAANDILEIEVTGGVTGTIRIELFEAVAPGHAARIAGLAEAGQYDGVVFHRVIDGFMAQTGDVQHGRAGEDLARAGTGGSDQPNLKAEFSYLPFERGMVGMARSSDPNSANSQFFIMFASAQHLNGQYTVVGRVLEGQEIVDQIKRGTGRGGDVSEPDVMQTVRVIRRN